MSKESDKEVLRKVYAARYQELAPVIEVIRHHVKVYSDGLDRGLEDLARFEEKMDELLAVAQRDGISEEELRAAPRR